MPINSMSDEEILLRISELKKDENNYTQVIKMQKTLYKNPF